MTIYQVSDAVSPIACIDCLVPMRLMAQVVITAWRLHLRQQWFSDWMLFACATPVLEFTLAIVHNFCRQDGRIRPIRGGGRYRAEKTVCPAKNPVSRFCEEAFGLALRGSIRACKAPRGKVSHEVRQGIRTHTDPR